MSPTQEIVLVEQTASCKPTILPTTLLLLIFNAFLMVLGLGGPLLLRLYFLHGGSRLWLCSFVQGAGFPILLIPIFVSSFINNRRAFQLPPSVFAAATFIGLISGLDCYLFGYGSSYLPVSTSSILMASQLSFTALFSFLINRQRFTAFSINAVVLLTFGPVVLGVSSGKDRPQGESTGKYYMGFLMAFLAAVLMGLMLPLLERMFKMMKQGVSYGIVMELQFVVGVSASVFCLVGMVINKDFQAIPREAKEFGLGEAKYYAVLICVAILFQLSILGLIGIISCSSSLFGGILNAVVLPLSEILAVIFFHEKFDGGKGIALALCLWGFTSYLYGERRQSQKAKEKEVEIPSSMP